MNLWQSWINCNGASASRLDEPFISSIKISADVQRYIS
jgi:hypothetical protein